MRNKRVRAFTIMEVTITMLISAILIGVTYTAYSIISKSYLSFNTKNGDMAAIERLDELLKKDFARASVIEKDSSGISLMSNTDTVNYKFNPDFIVRSSTIIDTFKVTNEAVNMLFEGQAINEISLTTEQNRIDELQIDLVFKNEKIPYHYHKQYSSEELFNRNTNAVN